MEQRKAATHFTIYHPDVKGYLVTVALRDGRGLVIPLPEPLAEEVYSGRVTLRMPKSLHRKVATMAQREGMSLNQFILAALSFRAGVFEVEKNLLRNVGVAFDGGASVARDTPVDEARKPK